MSAPRHVRIFKNGRSRAVRIPKDLDFFGDELLMRLEGDRVILERPPTPILADILARLKPIDEEWPEIDDPLPQPVDDFS